MLCYRRRYGSCNDAVRSCEVMSCVITRVCLVARATTRTLTMLAVCYCVSRECCYMSPQEYDLSIVHGAVYNDVMYLLCGMMQMLNCLFVAIVSCDVLTCLMQCECYTDLTCET